MNLKNLFQSFLCFLILCIGMLACDRNLEEPYSDHLTILCGDKSLVSGSEVLAKDVRVYQQNGIEKVELVSPFLYVHASEEVYYTFELSKEDCLGAEYGGLGQICVAGQCMESASTERFVLDNYQPDRSEFIQVHYRIGETYQHEKRDYRVKLSIKKQDTELQSITLKFSYDPAHKDPLPTDSIEVKPDPEPIPPVQPQEPALSNLLVMDFTGQNCGYCIHAIKSLAYQESKYPDNLVVVAIHTGLYNSDENFVYDDWSPYASNVGMAGLPVVVYNNVFESSDIRFHVGDLISKEPLYHSELTATCNVRSVNLNFRAETVQVEATKNKKVNVLFWVVENGLKGYQSGEGEDFIHNHVLRGHLNGVWGQPYTLGSIIQWQAVLPAKTLEPKNCHLIAVLVDAETHAFLDAVKVPLK